MLRLFVTYSKVLIQYIIMIKDTIHNRVLHIYTYIISIIETVIPRQPTLHVQMTHDRATTFEFLKRKKYQIFKRNTYPKRERFG